MYNPLSNIDLNNYIKEIDKKGVQIYDLNKLKANTYIEDIFNHRGHCILFYGPNNAGHWITCLRNPNKEIYFIDSFGEDPDYYNKEFLKCMRNNGIKQVHVNKDVLQNDKTQVCGRYGVILTAMNKMGIDPPIMIDFLKDGADKCGGNVDKFILKLTK